MQESEQLAAIDAQVRTVAAGGVLGCISGFYAGMRKHHAEQLLADLPVVETKVQLVGVEILERDEVFNDICACVRAEHAAACGACPCNMASCVE